MAGIYPNPADGGIDPGVAVPAGYDPVVDPIGSLAKYFSANCGVVLRPEVLNAIISQISAAIDFGGKAYDIGKGGTDLSEAIQTYIQLNMGAYAEATNGPQKFKATGTPTFYTYRQGQILWLKMPPVDQGGPPSSGASLDVDGLGERPIVRTDGSAVVVGDLLPDQVIGLAYRNNVWQMVTGGSDFMPVARARLPFYPSVNAVMGRMGIFAPQAGQILVPGSVEFLHRGIYLDNTSNYDLASRTFTTAINTVYHLRWSPTGGFVLKPVNDGVYNPGGYAETNPAFDSTFDDMIIARVATDQSNVASIVNLSNLLRYRTTVSKGGVYPSTGAPYQGNYTTFNVNWARQPECKLTGVLPPGGGRDTDPTIHVYTVDRYNVTIHSYSWHDAPVTYADYGYVYDLIMPAAG